MCQGWDRVASRALRARLDPRLRRLAERFGYHLLPRDFYQPVPELAELPADTFERRNPLLGIELDTAAQVSWAERELAPFTGEFGDGPPGFRWNNDYYETGDAELAYAFVRMLRPKRLVELGSGWSTLSLAHACRRNAADGDDCTYKVFNPYPPEILADAPPGVHSQSRLRAQDVPLEEFSSLEAGDLLFVDTSHTVKLGGDVNFIVLEVLPLLAPGVVVHFHDIWLPYEYHRILVEVMRLYWAEQYLLQAFLAFNPGFEVVFAAHAACHEHPERMRALIPRYVGENYPSSFWIRSRGQEAGPAAS